MPKINWNRVAVVAAASLAAVAWVSWATYGSRIAGFLAVDDPNPGEWGDTFGALNTLFGAVGFVVVALTLISQRQALELQQMEIAGARYDQHLQRFEGTYFELLGLMRELRANIRFSFLTTVLEGSGRDRSIETRAVDLVGFAALEHIARRMKFSSAEDALQVPTEETHATLVLRYQGILADQAAETGLGPYFRVIYTMLDRLRNDSVLAEVERVRLSKLLRSQLNGNEIVLMAANGLTQEAKDLSGLISEFRMLKYMPYDPLRVLFERVYPKQTFLARD